MGGIKIQNQVRKKKMVNIPERNTESSESVRQMIDTIQVVVGQIGHDLQELRMEINKSDSVALAKEHLRIVDGLKTAMKKIVALTQKKNSMNEYMMACKAKAMKQAIDEVDKDGKPVNTNEMKREMAQNQILSLDVEYQANKKILDDTEWERISTQLEIDCLKLDLKHVEFIVEARR
jgi:hypothetical protein